MDILSFIGVAIAFAAVLGGNFLEGGEFSALVNMPAAVLVAEENMACPVSSMRIRSLKSRSRPERLICVGSRLCSMLHTARISSALSGTTTPAGSTW